jgi:S1-C subfamily serine protease
MVFTVQARASRALGAFVLICTIVGCSGQSAQQQTAVRAAEASVVKVISLQPACGWEVQSSGFVIAPHHVLTLASNVAGSASGGLQVADASGISHRATVVLFDPRANLAVLDVPTLQAAALRFASRFPPESVALVAYLRGAPRPTVARAVAGFATDATVRGIYGGNTDLPVITVLASGAPGDLGAPVLNATGLVDGIINDGTSGHSPVYALSPLQAQPDAKAGAKLSTAVSDQRCVSKS